MSEWDCVTVPSSLPGPRLSAVSVCSTSVRQLLCNQESSFQCSTFTFCQIMPSSISRCKDYPIKCLKNLEDSPSIAIVLEQIWDIYWKRKDVGYFAAWYFFIQKHHFCRQLHCASRTNFSEQLIKFIIDELWLPQC